MKRNPLLLKAALPALMAIAVCPAAAQTPQLFEDGFEEGLSKWEISNPAAIQIIESGQDAHGKVLRMAAADARLYALIRGSESWGSYRIEGDVLFPTDENNYLGFIYNYNQQDRRVDLGSIYIKGNGSYIRANPRRDWNPGRTLYEEYRTDLTGNDAIRIGEWQHFAAEVAGRACHFYVGDMQTPKVTFDFFEFDSGQAGFKPRVVGGPVWIDNIRAVKISRLSYSGPPQPAGIDYRPENLATGWNALGPLTRTFPEVEQAKQPGSQSVSDDGRQMSWQRFDADPRGAIVTARITEFMGSRTVAYFTTTIKLAEGEQAELELSTADPLALWRNGVFEGYLDRDRYAWYDFGRNPDHPPNYGTILLYPGANHILVRVRGGQYATGGFFARVVRRSN